MKSSLPAFIRFVIGRSLGSPLRILAWGWNCNGNAIVYRNGREWRVGGFLFVTVYSFGVCVYHRQDRRGRYAMTPAADGWRPAPPGWSLGFFRVEPLPGFRCW